MNDMPPGIASNSPLIELKCVNRRYDNGNIEALRDVTLQVNRGDWMIITGPSGSGKSTLLNITCGLDKPSSGDVLFEGYRPRTAAKWTSLRARHIGFIFQSFNILPTLTVLENIQVPMFGLLGKAKKRRYRALELLERVGLSHRADHLPCNLSGGERQRVAIARSLANSPLLVLADEPTGNLDSKSAIQIMDLLTQIHTQDRTTIVMVTHNPVVAQYGNRWVNLVDGWIEIDTTSRLINCYS
jgi:ABC-type lipoprotein export system ATPase subunit